MKNLTWQNPEQLFVAQELINKVKSKCCGIKVYVNTLLKIKQKKKTIRGAVFVRRLRLVTYIQRTLLLLTELPDMRSSVIWSIMMLISFKYLALSRF